MSSDPNTGDGTAEKRRLTRRAFLRGAGSVGAAAALAPTLIGTANSADSVPAPSTRDDSTSPVQSGRINLTLNINGQNRTVTVEPRTTLLNTLRYYLDPALTGTKLVCDRGNCGACTVMMDGRTVYACMLLAADAVGKKIVTIEGLSSPEHLHPVQQAFVQRDALQCGFCTPGFVMSVTALLDRNPHPTVDEVKRGCAGNLCRCGSYPHIYDAALDAADQLRKGEA